MSDAALPQRLARAMGESQVVERIAAAQERFYKPVLEWVVHTRLHSAVLGHSIHPPLTDLTLGCWLSASILDVAGGVRARRGATVLIGAGLAASLPTAFSGAGDWAGLTGAERRIGAVHALAMDAATFLHLGSMIARIRGHHAAGVTLGLAGNTVVAGAGYLGGHLALNRGTARRITTETTGAA